MAKNSILAIAHADGRDYITPNDVWTALLGNHPTSEEKIRREVLEVLGGRAGTGAEDPQCCAWMAWAGRKNAKKIQKEIDG